MRKEILRMKDIYTTDLSVETVRNCHFHVFEHEIVGLVGKNHAGKSSLMGAVTGEYPCDSGEIWIDEHRKQIDSIQKARREGIFLIKDDSSLIDRFNIEDTMLLNYAFVRKKISYSNYVKKYRSALKLLKVSASPGLTIGQMNFHQRILIEIAQAFVCDARLLVFDNVFNMLSNTARQEMHSLFQILLSHGLSIVLIESYDDCIREYLHRLCIMRKGKVVGDLTNNEMHPDLILSLMEGEACPSKAEPSSVSKRPNSEDVILKFEKVYTEDGVLNGMTFELYKGETLGIWNRNRHSGPAVLDVLEGNLDMTSGSVTMNGSVFHGKRLPVKKSTLSTIPEKDIFFDNMNLGENISISALKRTAYAGLIPNELELKYQVQSLYDEYLSDPKFQLFSHQSIPDNPLAKKKTALCRAIASGADILVFNNPWLKMDVWEKELFSHDLLKNQKHHVSQVIISSQLEDLRTVCDRIIQVEEGKITGEV